MKRMNLYTLILVLGTLTLSAQDLTERKPPENWIKEAYSRDIHRPGVPAFTPDPFIQEVIADIKEDSVRATLRSLQDFGSRFLLNDDRKEIAQWLADRFISYGMTDVRLDSFLCIVTNFPQYADTLWQYNVVATLTGKSAPEEEYIIGGHYDSYCTPNPFTNAPGVDDNGSAVAAALEVARVLMKHEFEPEATIKFSLFAAEELGLYGSIDLARKARENNDDIRYVLNLDMIANNPDSLKEVTIIKYPMAEWAAYLAADVYETYTNLQVNIPVDYLFGGSDSYSYFQFGYPAIFVQEHDFSPYWHKPGDTVGNCNIEYCTEVTRGACALILQQQILPAPTFAFAYSTVPSINIYWTGTENANIKGYNLYRSESSGTGYELVNSGLLADTFYYDDQAIPGRMYYYIVKGVNGASVESMPTEEVYGARFAFTDTLLVVNYLDGSEVTPDSVLQFYDAILDTIPYTWFDQNDLNQIRLSDYATHRNIMLVSNNPNQGVGIHPNHADMSLFFENGGNMLVSAFVPSKLIDNNNQYPLDFPEFTRMHMYFKADSVFRKIGSMMYQAYPESGEYDTLRCDTLKTMYEGYPGEIYYLEVYRVEPEGSVIYRFDSKHDPGTTLGFQQNEPVGIEYMGDDYKTVLLSFPLFWMDTTDARDFLHYVIHHKFADLTDIPEIRALHNKGSIISYPNPFADETTIVFVLDESTEVSLAVYDSRGVLVDHTLNQYMNIGEYHIGFNASGLAPGLYKAVLTTRFGSWSCSMVKTR